MFSGSPHYISCRNIFNVEVDITLPKNEMDERRTKSVWITPSNTVWVATFLAVWWQQDANISVFWEIQNILRIADYQWIISFAF